MHLNNKTVYIEKWVYNKPKLMPNQDGNIILISKGCFGPVEVYEWGIDANKQAYERYEWLENDFYQGDNYWITIAFICLFVRIYTPLIDLYWSKTSF